MQTEPKKQKQSVHQIKNKFDLEQNENHPLQPSQENEQNLTIEYSEPNIAESKSL